MTKKNFTTSVWSSMVINFKDKETKRKITLFIESKFPKIYFENLDDSILIEYQDKKIINKIKRTLERL